MTGWRTRATLLRLRYLYCGVVLCEAVLVQL